jgi:hypothetical protein
MPFTFANSARALSLVAIVVAASGQAPPEPSASPLKEIGRVRARAFCTTISKTVAPYVQGILNNDEWIKVAHYQFLTLGVDVAQKRNSQLDRARADRVVGAMATNLGIMDKLMNTPGRFAQVPVTQDDRDLLTIRTQLEAIGSAQKRTLDLVNGALETESLGRMQSEMNNQIKNATSGDTGATTPVPSGDPGSYISVAGLPTNPAIPGVDPRQTLNGTTTGNTIWDKLAAQIRTQYVHQNQLEYQTAPLIVKAAKECGGTQDQPAAAPSAAPTHSG